MGDGLRHSERRDFAGDAGSSARNLLSGRNSEGKIREYEKKLYEKKWLDLPWQKVRESMEVKRFEQEGELYGPRVKEDKPGEDEPGEDHEVNAEDIPVSCGQEKTPGTRRGTA